MAWAAGVWGDPLARAANLVGLEVGRGLARAKGALDYAVVSDANGTLDAAKTAAFRARIRTTRGELPLFDRTRNRITTGGLPGRDRIAAADRAEVAKRERRKICAIEVDSLENCQQH